MPQPVEQAGIRKKSELVRRPPLALDIAFQELDYFLEAAKLGPEMRHIGSNRPLGAGIRQLFEFVFMPAVAENLRFQNPVGFRGLLLMFR